MAEEVTLPELGESIEEGVVLEWLVAVGDTVEVDQPLLEISTDKIDTEIPSPAAGVVTELRAAVDDTINVGQVIAVIDPAGASAGGGDASPAADSGAKEAAAEKPAEKKAPAKAADKPADKPAEKKPAPAPAPAPASGPADRGDKEFDLVVLGAGTGGYSTALRAAQLGLKVGLIEKAKVGGTCLHWGCIPTKAILQSAEMAEHAQTAGEFGVKVDYQGLEVAKINEHKQTVVDNMHKGLQGALKKRGVETIHGVGTFTSPSSIDVQTDDGVRTVTGRATVVATGSKPRELPFAQFNGTTIISSDHALGLETLPEKAIILGSGAVGMEFATAWSAFGVDVTIVELEDRLLPLEDADISKEMGRHFRKRGVNVLTGAKLTKAEASETNVTCTIDAGGKEEKLDADLLLVAVGRGPVTDGIGLEAIGVTTDRGFVIVDDYCRTSAPGVFAVGDVIPTLGLAHASFAEGMMIADQLAGLSPMPIDYAGVPRVTYSHPEVGSVGLTEAQAKEQGYDVVIEKYPFQALARAAMMKATGTVKIVAEKDANAEGGAGRVLGVHIIGPKATDLIAEGQLIYNWEATPADVAPYIHPHPSLAEALGEAHLALAGRALHG